MDADAKQLQYAALSEVFRNAIEPAEYAIAYDLAKDFLADNLTDSNAYFLFAYACYEVSYERREVLIEAEHSFETCLEMNPSIWDFQMSIYHLGFVYFRQKRYVDCLRVLGRRDPDFFISIGQSWRIPKLDEVELVCRFYLHPDKLSLQATEQLVRQYARIAEPIMAPLLLEMGDCLSDLLDDAGSCDANLEDICEVVLRLIRSLDQVDSLKRREGRFFERL